MANNKLEKDQVYLLKPTKIVKTQKQVKSAKFGGMCRRFDITFVDKYGEVFECEWLCCGEENTDFIEGVPRYIKVSWTSDKGSPTIEPYEEPGSQTPPPVTPSWQKTTDYIDTRVTPVPNAHNLNVSGKSYIFTLAYAKDIKSAEIAARGWGQKVTDEDIKDVMRWADMLSNDIYEKVTF